MKDFNKKFYNKMATPSRGKIVIQKVVITAAGIGTRRARAGCRRLSKFTFCIFQGLWRLTLIYQNPYHVVFFLREY